MWFSRIISSFFGIRKKNDLQKDLQKISLGRLVFLFLVINVLFVSFVIIITKFFI